MELKRYQERVVNEVRVYLETLAAKQAKGERFAAQAAWLDALIPGRAYQPRINGLNKDLPTFCIKVPTGGGKTLLATQILGLIYKTILAERNGTGLVLWIVPSDQIYKDTLRALRDRHHFYRESLEFAVSRRIEVWEKHEIARLTPGQLASNLNVLIVKLQGTNRQDRESLKFFQDSGGNIAAHFPPENEPEKHRALKARIPNLDMLEENAATGAHLVKTSIANLVRLCEPAVILDEGHRATSALARQTIEGFNPRIVVELSATPPQEANVLVRVSGRELLDEEMIKLPINIANSNQRLWKDVLTSAKDRREKLARKAVEHWQEADRLIRPIVLVQVERTGGDQREAGMIHSEHVKEYLIQNLGVPEPAIAIKTSEQDDLEGRVALLDESCPVEWIITKAALQEGWDCPFAYVLVSLSESGSERGMTQLVGRILRQPYQNRTRFQELNESYVYCLRQSAADISRQVKNALENEGYEGDAASVVDASGGGRAPVKRKAHIREKYLIHYKKPFEGRIFLPRFCVKMGSDYVALDYYRHLLAEVDITKFNYAAVDWDFADELAKAKDQFYRITLESELEKQAETEAEHIEDDTSVRAWLVANLGVEWLSAKQLRFVVEHVCERLGSVKGCLALIKFVLRDKIDGFIQQQTDLMAEKAFYGLHAQKRLCFYLHCVKGRFEIPPEIEIGVTGKLRHDNDDEVERSLFDYVPRDLNTYETDVALSIDRHPEVLWWYRNLVGSSNFSIQGYRRSPIYPDFVVQRGDAGKNEPEATVIVVESKGKQLKGSEDTKYKRRIAQVFSDIGKKVTWQELSKGFKDQQFRFQVLDEGEYASQDWREDLKKLLNMR